MTAEAAMSELWGALCPDCGPSDYANIVAEAVAIREQRDECRAALNVVAMSPSPVCRTGDHAASCDCGGDIVRAAIAKAEAR